MIDWINDEQQDVLLYGECLNQHEEHDIEELM
jgi:hypothetical protein